MREWLEIRDFSQGMNQQNAVTASEQPWDLQDVLISEKPELRRRGPFTDRAERTTKDNLNKIEDWVLAASTYNFLGTSATIAVTSDQRIDDEDNTVWAVCIWIIEANTAPVLKWFRTAGKATMADIAGAWTDPDGDRLDNRPDAFIVTTDKGTYVISYNSSSDFEWFQVASSYYTLSTTTNRLKGSGFRTCANVGGYTFLGGRFEKDRAGGGDSNAKAAPRRMWWSKAYNSESWKNKTGDIGKQGGTLVLPFTEAIRHFTELDGNLVIFTKNQIHTQSVTPNPDDWLLQQRADIGTVYPRSISRYEDSLIFANADGVYQFSGYETICLTEDSISELYRKQFYQEVLDDQNPESPATREVVGIVIGDYYLLSLNDYSGYAFCLHIPTGAWVRFSNIPLLAASWSPAGDRRAFGFMRTTISGQPYTRIVRLDRMFLPDGTSQSSPAGLDTVVAPDPTVPRGPKMRLELRRYSLTGLGIPKLWRSLAVLYDAKALASGSGQLNLSFSASPDKDNATWTSLSPLLATTSMTEVRQAFAAKGSAIGVRIEESGALGRMNIASIELGYKELRRGRA